MDNRADNFMSTTHDSNAGGNGDKQLKLAGIRVAYLADLPGQVEVLQSLLDDGDFVGVKKHAHRIKGTSGTYRLFTVADLMKEIEYFADRCDAASVQQKLDGLADAIELLTTQAHQEYDTLTKERIE